MAQLKIKKLKKDAQMPYKASEDAGAFDLYACIDEDVFGNREVLLHSFETKMIGTGIAAEIPKGYAGMIYARSGLSIKQGLAPANKVGVVDADYRGEIMVALYNHDPEKTAVKVVKHGDRIAQLVIHKIPEIEIVEVDELSDTVRGEGGFGSTGR